MEFCNELKFNNKDFKKAIRKGLDRVEGKTDFSDGGVDKILGKEIEKTIDNMDKMEKHIAAVLTNLKNLYTNKKHH